MKPFYVFLKSEKIQKYAEKCGFMREMSTFVVYVGECGGGDGTLEKYTKFIMFILVIVQRKKGLSKSSYEKYQTILFQYQGHCVLFLTHRQNFCLWSSLFVVSHKKHAEKY